MKKCIVTCHGFTGYPSEMEPLGKYFENKGYYWHNLTLPGHGTNPEDLKNTKWTDWTSYVLKEVRKMHDQYPDSVYFSGLSLGGIITLWVAENIPSIRAIAPLSAPYDILKTHQKLMTILPFGWWLEKPEEEEGIIDPDSRSIHKSYTRFHTDSVKSLNKLMANVRKNLYRISMPILLVHSTKDESIHISNVDKIYQKVSSEIKEKFIVENSGHVLTRDYDKNSIFDKVYAFFEEN